MSRVISAVLLAAVVFVPTAARTHDRLQHQRTPAQEYSRFRWTNSCESVPQKETTVVAIAPVALPAQETLDAPSRTWRGVPLTDVPLPVAARVPSPHGLRAPPALAL